MIMCTHICMPKTFVQESSDFPHGFFMRLDCAPAINKPSFIANKALITNYFKVVLGSSADTHLLVKWAFGVMPNSPKRVTKTLASVPAPRTSPVTVTTS